LVDALVDSSIIIDMLRGYPAAKRWAEEGHIVAISRATWFELIEGTRNLQGQRAALDVIQRFVLIEFSQEIVEQAAALMLKWRLSHNIDAFDCLIAATAETQKLPLLTRNLKHFRPLIGELARTPYT
jgi:predicted nucleic acid-binding protein